MRQSQSESEQFRTLRTQTAVARTQIPAIAVRGERIATAPQSLTQESDTHISRDIHIDPEVAHLSRHPASVEFLGGARETRLLHLPSLTCLHHHQLPLVLDPVTLHKRILCDLIHTDKSNAKVMVRL